MKDKETGLLCCNTGMHSAQEIVDNFMHSVKQPQALQHRTKNFFNHTNPFLESVPSRPFPFAFHFCPRL